MNLGQTLNQASCGLAILLGISFDSGSLFASVIWGALGSGIFLYGWKQKEMAPLGCGLAMVMVSYFIDAAGMMSLVSVIILVILYWLKKQGY